MYSKLESELKSFKSLWKGGYFEGNPLNPMAKSGYNSLGFMSVLHATYLRCIKPYINDGVVSLEIGPGRGAWTKTLLPSKEVYALDALSAEHNKFFEYLGHPNNVQYFQIEDFNCNVLPDNYFDYMFSFGCLCHVSFEGITKYAENIFPKLKRGSNCFWMIADYDKYNKAFSDLNSFSLFIEFIRQRHLPIMPLLKHLTGIQKIQIMEADKDDEPSPGRWYNAGTERTCAMLEKTGYEIVDPDVGTCLRDPIIHFRVA